MPEKSKISRESVQNLVEVAKRISYAIRIELIDGSVSNYLTSDISRITRDRIEVVLCPNPKGIQPFSITFEDIEDISAVSLRKN